MVAALLVNVVVQPMLVRSISDSYALRHGYFASFPRLTEMLVTAHPPHTIATAKGHLDQIRQGLDSTSQDILPSRDNMPPFLLFCGSKNKNMMVIRRKLTDFDM